MMVYKICPTLSSCFGNNYHSWVTSIITLKSLCLKILYLICNIRFNLYGNSYLNIVDRFTLLGLFGISALQIFHHRHLCSGPRAHKPFSIVRLSRACLYKLFHFTFPFFLHESPIIPIRHLGIRSNQSVTVWTNFKTYFEKNYRSTNKYRVLRLYFNGYNNKALRIEQWEEICNRMTIWHCDDLKTKITFACNKSWDKDTSSPPRACQ